MFENEVVGVSSAVVGRLVSLGHAFEEAVEVVEARALHGLATPTLVHEVVELAAATRRRRGGHAGPTPSAAPLTGVGYYLVRQMIFFC